MTDIPVTIPADEAFRDQAIDLLWPSNPELVRRNTLPHQEKYIREATEQLRDAYIRGADAVTVHYENRAEAPTDRTWKVTVPLGQGFRTLEVQSPEWATTQEGDLMFGFSKESGFVPEIAAFAHGAWLSVVQQAENNVPVVGS